MDKEEKTFNVDYKGWIDRKRRYFSDVKWLPCFYEEERKMFGEWAETAKYGDKICICGVNIECVPSRYEISQRCRYYINN